MVLTYQIILYSSATTQSQKELGKLKCNKNHKFKVASQFLFVSYLASYLFTIFKIVIHIFLNSKSGESQNVIEVGQSIQLYFKYNWTDM